MDGGGGGVGPKAGKCVYEEVGGRTDSEFEDGIQVNEASKNHGLVPCKRAATEIVSKDVESFGKSGSQELLQTFWESSSFDPGKKKRRRLAPHAEEQRFDVLEEPESESNKSLRLHCKSLKIQENLLKQHPDGKKSLNLTSSQYIATFPESSSLLDTKKVLPDSLHLKEETLTNPGFYPISTIMGNRFSRQDPKYTDNIQFVSSDPLPEASNSTSSSSNDSTKCNDVINNQDQNTSQLPPQSTQTFDIDCNPVNGFESRDSVDNSSSVSEGSLPVSSEMSDKFPRVVMRNLDFSERYKISEEYGISLPQSLHNFDGDSLHCENTTKIFKENGNVNFERNFEKNGKIDQKMYSNASAKVLSGDSSQLDFRSSSICSVPARCRIFPSKSELSRLEHYLMRLSIPEKCVPSNCAVLKVTVFDIGKADKRKTVPVCEEKLTSSESSDEKVGPRRSKRAKRICRNTKQKLRQTPMGLPKPLRLKKNEFTVEEIYLNKNFQTPTEKKWETIFEFPKENKDGTLSNHEKKKKKRRFDFTVDPGTRKQKRKLQNRKWKRRKLQDSFGGDADKILQEKLDSLDEALKLADLSP